MTNLSFLTKVLILMAGAFMKAVKISLKGRITLGKTIFDYAGALPNLGMTIEEMRERAIEKAAREDA